MAKRAAPEAGNIQFVWEGILKWSAFAVMCLQLAMGILQYLIPDKITVTLFKFEKWTVLALILAVLVYVLYTKAKAPRLMFRIRNFTKGLFCPELIILSVFFLWSILCTVSADSRYSANFFRLNDSSLFDTFMSFFVIFIMAYVFRGDSARKMMERLFHVFCAGLTVFMIYVLYVIFKPDLINLPGGGQIGLDSNVRLCINCNPNTTGAIAEVILLMCLYMVITKRGVLRWLYAAASVVHYLILVFSNSITCILATGIAVAAIVGKLCFDAMKNRVLWQRILISVLLAVLATYVIFGLSKPVYTAHEKITHFSEITEISNSTESVDSTESVNSTESINATDDNNSNNTAVGRDIKTFSKRTELWTAAVKSVFQDAKHFFFGVTPAGVFSEIHIWTDGKRNAYTHNQFMEVAVAHGIPGLLMYLVWLGTIAGSCLKIVCGKVKEMHKGYIVLAGMILMLVLSNLMEATLLYYRWYMEGIFFLICGMVTYKTKT